MIPSFVTQYEFIVYSYLGCVRFDHYEGYRDFSGGVVSARHDRRIEDSGVREQQCFEFSGWHLS